MVEGLRPWNAESRLSPLHPAAPCRVWGLELPAKAEMTEEERERVEAEITVGLTNVTGVTGEHGETSGVGYPSVRIS